MAYFKAQLGPPLAGGSSPASDPPPAGASTPEQKTPLVTPESEAQGSEPQRPRTEKSLFARQKPLFAPQLGHRPAGQEQAAATKQPPACPLTIQESAPPPPAPGLTCPLCGETLRKKRVSTTAKGAAGQAGWRKRRATWWTWPLYPSGYVIAVNRHKPWSGATGAQSVRAVGRNICSSPAGPHPWPAPRRTAFANAASRRCP